MLNIILTIVLFSLLMISFKLFTRFNVNNLHAIIINYFVAGICGAVFSEKTLNFTEILSSPWIYHAFAVGLFFILIFNLLALASQKVGIAITTVANKMSLVIPVSFALIFYDHDTFNWIKITGILLALSGIYFSSTQSGKLSFDQQYLWLILIIFFGQGVADIVFNHAQQTAVSNEDKETFFFTLFFIAGIFGTLFSFPRLISGENKFNINSLVFGIIVGVPNYFSLYFFFKALESGLPPSAVYPLVSMGIVIFSAISGFVLFKEKLSSSNWFGIFLAVVAIAIISFS